MKHSLIILSFIFGFSCLAVFAGISQPVFPSSKKGKAKLKVKEVDMTPSLASELSYTNILVLVYSNAPAQVVLGPMIMEGKFNKKTGEAKGWKYKEKTKDPKFKLGAKVVAKKESFKLKVSDTLPDAVLIYVPGKAAVKNEMVTIPAGSFFMGSSNTYFFSDSMELPVHQVTISEFMIETFEVSNGQMCRVLQWAYDNNKLVASPTVLKNASGDQQTLINLANYASDIKFENGRFYAKDCRDGYPCSVATWYGALAYCNYKSEMEGLQPCVNFTDWSCDFSKTGYRLPTEAEWEKAARGGLTAQWYPWPGSGGNYEDHIDGSKANYFQSTGPYNSEVSVCGYYNGTQIPAGTDMANGYGLYDMAGNLEEWCWDWFKWEYYKDPSSTQADTTGPVQDGTLQYKVVRGGRWGDQKHFLRCAARNDVSPDSSAYRGVGFRCVRRP